MVSWRPCSDKWVSPVSCASFFSDYFLRFLCNVLIKKNVKILKSKKYFHFSLPFSLRSSKVFWLEFWERLFCRCSLLISEHSIKSKKTQSPSLPGLSKEKKHSPVGSPSQKAGAAVCLGGPATTKYGMYCILLMW